MRDLVMKLKKQGNNWPLSISYVFSKNYSRARPDASTGSAVNTSPVPLCARPELVEGFERS